MSEMIDKLYGKFVKPLQKEIVKWMQSRVAELGVDASEEMLKEDAYKIAVMLVLSASWGAGDALAGYILRKVGEGRDKEICEKWKESFEKIGVKNMPKPTSTLYLFFWKVCEEADFGNERVNKMLRDLDKHARSGGGYIPSWVTEEEDDA